MKVLINGATGYLGKQLVDFLKSNGIEVTKIGKDPIQSTFHFNLSKNIGDQIFHLPKGKFDCFIFAAFDFSNKKNDEVIINNSKYLIDEILGQGTSKIIYISSISSFDQAKSNYGKIKFAIEGKILSIGGVVVRPGLLFSDHSNSILIKKFKLISKIPFIPLIGKGDQELYFTNVNELNVDLLAILRNYEKYRANTYTLINELPFTIKDFILYLKNNKKVIFICIPTSFFSLFFKTLKFLKIPTGFDYDNFLGIVYQKKNLKLTKIVSNHKTLPSKTCDS